MWPCEYETGALFEWQPLAHRFCVGGDTSRCVEQLIAATPVQLMPGDGGEAEAEGEDGGDEAGEAASCLRFVAAFQPLLVGSCDAEPKTLWEHDPASGEFHYSREKSLCLDYFEQSGRWGVWSCHHRGNERFASLEARRARGEC